MAEDGISEGNVSDHGAIRGPYRQYAKDRHFPIYAPVLDPVGAPQRFSRPQMSTGNGFAPFVPHALGSSEEHLKRGVSIGDVGYADEDGSFTFCFNIFFPKNDPIQPEDLPRNFTPIEPPLVDWKIRRVPDQFPPGSVVPSEGIEVARVSESPLKLDFSTSAREAAVMVLPSGASREDLVDTHKLHEYIKDHAADWYQHRNWYSGMDSSLPSSPGMNGTLYLITGSDKAKSWANAALPQNAFKEALPMRFSYDGSSREERFTDQFSQDSLNAGYRDKEDHPDYTYSVFLRGIMIALGTASWIRHIPEIHPDQVPSYSLHLRPIYDPQTRVGKILQWLQSPKKEYIPSYDEMFHPSTFLLQILVNMTPEADIAFVDDSVWCSMINGQSPTHQTFVKLVRRIAENYDVLSTNGITTFVKKEEQPLLQVNPSRVRRFFSFTSRSPAKKLLKVMDKLLSDRPKASGKQNS